MDTTVTIGAGILLITAVLLVLVSGAEAGIIAITRSRVRVNQANGLPGLLHGYIRQRHRILDTLSIGAVVAIVIGTATFRLIVLRGHDFSIAAEVAIMALSLLVAALLRQTARTIALLNPETAAVLLARPTRVLQLLFSPLTWLVHQPVGVLLRLLGRSAGPPELNPADELRAVLEADGEADQDGTHAEERRMMRGILAMSSQTVREIMSPRMDLTAVPTSASVGDVMKVIHETGLSRIPIYEESIDHIVGVVYAKDLLAYLLTGELRPELRDIARPPYFVPETKRANELLADLRRDQVHMAIAVDEYGGTAGVVTVEDLLEEIVGEIADEYDTEEMEVQRISDTEAIVDARLPLDELNELFSTGIDSEDFDTVGGLIFSLLGRLATPGDEVVSAEHGLRLRVLSILGRRIKKVRIECTTPAAPTEEEQAATA